MPLSSAKRLIYQLVLFYTTACGECRCFWSDKQPPPLSRRRLLLIGRALLSSSTLPLSQKCATQSLSGRGIEQVRNESARVNRPSRPGGFQYAE